MKEQVNVWVDEWVWARRSGWVNETGLQREGPFCACCSNGGLSPEWSPYKAVARTWVTNGHPRSLEDPQAPLLFQLTLFKVPGMTAAEVCLFSWGRTARVLISSVLHSLHPFGMGITIPVWTDSHNRIVTFQPYLGVRGEGVGMSNSEAKASSEREPRERPQRSVY